MEDTARLLADIGGTNARFAWQDAPGAAIGEPVILACEDHAGLPDLLAAALVRLQRPTPPDCAIAIACPVAGDRIRLTNLPWEFSVAEVRARFGMRRLEVLNDFTALAMAVPALAPRQLRQVGGGEAVAGAPIAVIGPGTGLGVSGLVPDGRGGWIPLAGEGGHVTLPAGTPREQQVVAWLAARFGHASAERAVSGQGLENLHQALLAIDGVSPAQVPPRTAAEVCGDALAGADPHSVEALQLFCAFLGMVAGNLALTLGAQGGVYLGGGILPRLGPAFEASPFRERFEAKGRFRTMLQRIPAYVITAAQPPALQGAARALDAAIARG